MIQLIVSTIFAGVGGFMLYKGWHHLRTAGRIVDTATSTIRAVAIGFAELTGTVKADEPITAPFSKRPCVHYHCEIEKYETRGTGDDKKTTWYEVWQETKNVPFAIDDGTGSILVRSDEAEYNVVPDKRWYLKRGSRFTIGRWKESKDLFGAVEIEPTKRGRSLVGDYRFTERVIEPDEAVFVLGTVARDDDVAIGLDRNYGPFVVSDREEADLVRSMRIGAVLYIVFGVVFLTAGITLGYLFLTQGL